MSPVRSPDAPRPTLHRIGADLKARLDRATGRRAASRAEPEADHGPSARGSTRSDPIFAAIAASREIEAAADALDDAHESDLTDRQNAAQAAAFATVPTTWAGLQALAAFADFHVSRTIGPDWRASAPQDYHGEVLLALVNAIQAERSEPLVRSPRLDPADGTGAGSPDAFLTDIAPELLPLLDAADAEWTRVSGLYRAAEEMAGAAPAHDAPAVAWKAHADRWGAALDASGYSAAWDAMQPLWNRIGGLVDPRMDVPVQTLDGLLLKQRIGRTFEHCADYATADLARLARARFGYAEREARR